MFFGEGARNLGGDRIHKEFEQCCSALKNLLRPILPGPAWAFTFKRDKSRGFKAEG